MSPVIRKVTALLLMVLTASSLGCLRGPLGWQRTTLNHPISAQDVRFIVPGKTHLQEVVDRLGSPDEIGGAEGQMFVRFRFTDGRSFRANLGWALRFFSPIAPFLVFGGSGIGTDLFQLTCDDQWVVRDYAFAKHTDASEFRLIPFGE